MPKNGPNTYNWFWSWLSGDVIAQPVTTLSSLKSFLLSNYDIHSPFSGVRALLLNDNFLKRFSKLSIIKVYRHSRGLVGACALPAFSGFDITSLSTKDHEHHPLKHHSVTCAQTMKMTKKKILHLVHRLRLRLRWQLLKFRRAVTIIDLPVILLLKNMDIDIITDTSLSIAVIGVAGKNTLLIYSNRERVYTPH
jgi:hypothetical protein